MANPRLIQKYPITWTSNQSQLIGVKDVRDIDITVVGTGTITVYGSADMTVEGIDFTSPSTISNSYAEMVIADLTTPNTYATSLAVTAETKIGEVNTNLLTWISVSRDVDTVDAFITVCDNS